MKKKILLSLSLLTVISAFLFTAVGTDDPLITESYLNDVFMQEVKDYIDANKGGSSFEVLSIEKGKTFIGKSGCEVILRQGKAEILGSDLGGLSDVTLAGDLSTGYDMPANHLLIIPRDDGRGFKAKTNVVIMVKGNYDIK